MCGALATSAPVAVEHRAGKVEPLLDVHRIGGVLQRHAHLLGDRHEEVVEHLQHHRVGLGAERCLAPLLLGAAQQHMVLGGDLRLPAGLDHDRLVALDDQRRAGDLAGPASGLAPVDAARRARRRRRRSCAAVAGLRPSPGASGRSVSSRPCARAVLALDVDRLDDHRLVVVDEAELRLVRRLEAAWRASRSSRAAKLHRQRRVGAVVADVQDRPPGRRRPRGTPCSPSSAKTAVGERRDQPRRWPARMSSASGWISACWREANTAGQARCRRPKAGRRRDGSAPPPCRARRRPGRHAGRRRRRSS